MQLRVILLSVNIIGLYGVFRLTLFCYVWWMHVPGWAIGSRYYIPDFFVLSLKGKSLAELVTMNDLTIMTSVWLFIRTGALLRFLVCHLSNGMLRNLHPIAIRITELMMSDFNRQIILENN